MTELETHQIRDPCPRTRNSNSPGATLQRPQNTLLPYWTESCCKKESHSLQPILRHVATSCPRFASSCRTSELHIPFPPKDNRWHVLRKYQRSITMAPEAEVRNKPSIRRPATPRACLSRPRLGTINTPPGSAHAVCSTLLYVPKLQDLKDPHQNDERLHHFVYTLFAARKKRECRFRCLAAGAKSGSWRSSNAAADLGGPSSGSVS